MTVIHESKNLGKCPKMLGLANRAKFDSFLLFLKLLLSNHPKTIIEPSSMTQDSTLDTQQGGFWEKKFHFSRLGKTEKWLASRGF